MRGRRVATKSNGRDVIELRINDDGLDRLADLVAERLDVQHAGPESWVGVTDAAAHLGCKRQRIYDLVYNRAIPFRKDGSRLLFRLSDLDAWLGE